MARLHERLWGRAHRLAYNLLALVSLVPLLVWEHAQHAPLLYTWPSWAWPLRLVLLSVALWLGVSGARAFDLWAFTGLDIFKRDSARVPGSDALMTEGIFARVRHPWYLAGLILLWLRDMHLYALCSSLLLSIYLVIGARLEEQRMLQRYGEVYAVYRRSVPMFLPRLFLRRI